MLIIPGTFVYDEAKNEYIVEEFIGNGAFGNVYKIKRVNDETTWALKTIISNFSDEQSLIAFKNEINMAMKVNNSQVIKYIFAHDGSIYPELPPYIIMEYANNGTLKALIDKRRADKVHFNDEELKSLFFQLIAGMKAVNQVLVHRDIKPDNILLSNSEIKISDFGLSKVSADRTRTITFKGIGHLKYYAPEAWMNDKNTTQMDIYSMGLVFYELATLKYPYKVMNEADVEQWRNAHLFSEPLNPHTANPNISPVITGVIMKMLEKSTNNRFKSWDEIEKYLGNDIDNKSEFSGVIEAMLKNRLAKDNSDNQKELEEKKQKKQEEDFCKLINYQFKKDILNPIEQFIENFNKLYPQGKVNVAYSDRLYMSNRIKISLISGRSIEVVLEPIIERNFIRKVQRNSFFGELATVIENQTPYLNKRKVVAWGGLYVDDKKGFNILLLDKEGEIYGEWVILENTNSGLSRNMRPEPFAFQLNELEKEIQLVNVMHIYNSKILNFDINKFYEYISMYNN